RTDDALGGALETAVREQVDALIVLGSPVISAQAATQAASLRLPTMVELTPVVRANGLLAYGPRVRDLFRPAATYVDPTLKGADPAELPVEPPTTVDFVLILDPPPALGLAIPQPALLQATEVVQ